MPRSYCCQYRESDLDFVHRMLTEEVLSWRFEQNDDGPGVVLFADSSQVSAGRRVRLSSPSEKSFGQEVTATSSNFNSCIPDGT
jgi:uncharacterized protein involved in type VI secretion and phage assembly